MEPLSKSSTLHFLMFPLILALIYLNEAKWNGMHNMMLRNKASKDLIQTSPSKIHYSFFDQKLDHFNVSNNQTFKQRYLADDSYYAWSHLMFVYISGEQTLAESVLEHRYVSGMNNYIFYFNYFSYIFFYHFWFLILT